MIYVDAAKQFLQRLKGVIDPEKKRKIIGEEFANVFVDMLQKKMDLSSGWHKELFILM